MNKLFIESGSADAAVAPESAGGLSIRRRVFRFSILAGFCALLLIAGALSAQEFRAGLGGIVRDAQGTVVPQVFLGGVL